MGANSDNPEQTAIEIEEQYHPGRTMTWRCVNNIFRDCAGRPEFTEDPEIRSSINEESDFILVVGFCRRDWRTCEKCR